MSEEHSLIGSVLKGFVLYKKANTVFHRAAPVTKIMYLVVVSILALTIGDIFVLGTIAVIVLVSVIIAKVPRSSIKIFFIATTYMILIFAILWSVVGPYTGTAAGEVLWHLYYKIPISNYNLIIDFSLYENNLLQAIRLALSLFIMALGTVLLLTTTSQKEIVYGLKSMGLPYAGAFVLGLTFRAIGMFGQDYVTIKEALMARGVNFEKGSILSRLKNQVYIFIPLMIVSLRRITTISDAIESRAFGIGKKRTYFFAIKASIWDYLVSFGMVLAMIILLYYRYVLGMFDVGYYDWRDVLALVMHYLTLIWTFLLGIAQGI